MVERAAAVERTRERIVAATVNAHRELGIQSTSWDEIACRAGVGVGTVYRHFRTLGELLPACGEIVEQTMALPAPAEIPRVFQGARSVRARIERLVQLVFTIYERAGRHIQNIRDERDQIAELEPWHQMIENSLAALLDEALQPLAPDRQQKETARALIDLATWQAFQQRDLSNEETVETVARLIDSEVRPTRAARRQGSAPSTER
ncbi:MAG: TetR/AcrR family transcriptional regulator [Trebonia sp.]